MGVSTLIKEDDEFIYLTRYIHDDPDEHPEWIFDENNQWKYPEPIIMADDSAAYELRMEYRIRKTDATVIIDKVS